MIWRFLAALVLVYFAAKGLLWLTRYLRSFPSRESQVTGKENSEIQDMVRDPVCGLYVPGRDALKIVVHGAPVYFCSEQCRRKFVEGVR
jgi:uncharacterized protein